jgi:MFS family permease
MHALVASWLGLYRNIPFMGLWLGQLFSQLADRVIYVVFIAYLVHAHYTDELYTSYLYVSFTIPAILLTAIAGVFVDRLHKPTLLIVTNLLRGLLTLLLPVAAFYGLLPLYVLAFALSMVTQFFVPAESAMIPCLVSKAHLTQANSLFTTTMMGSVIFGFALGDPLINWVSLQHVHLAVAGFFFVAALCLLSLYWRPSSASPEAVTEANTVACSSSEEQASPPRSLIQEYQHFWEELCIGFNYIRSHSVVWQAMAKLALLFSAVVALCILCISYTKHFLYLSPMVAARKFAYLIAVSGIGMGSGALLVGSLAHAVPRMLLVYGGMLVMGLALLGMALVPTVFTSLASVGWVLPAPPWSHSTEVIVLTHRMVASYSCAALMGVGAAAVAIPLQALLHELIPEDCRGKVLGVQFTVLSTSSTLPALFAGLGSQWLGVQSMFVLASAPFIVWGTLGLLSFMKQKLGKYPSL